MKTSPVLSSLLLFLILAVSARAEGVVVEEDFSRYTGVKTGDRPLTDRWQLVKGSMPALEARFATKSGMQLVLGNGVVAMELPEEVAGTFEFEVALLHTSWMRYQWAGLFNKGMTEGYVVFWDSGTEKIGRGKGVVGIAKVKPEEGELSFLTKGEVLAKDLSFDRQGSPMQEPFLTLRLVWHKSSGELVLECDGVQVASANDTDLSQFETVVIGGNEKGVFDRVSVKGR